MRYAIADIHGCCRTFQTLLAKLRVRETDTLYLLGDYVDRGPDSKGVLDTIMGLSCRVVALRGNHEDLWLKVFAAGMDWRRVPTYNYWMHMGMMATRRSFGDTDPGPYRTFLERLPLYHEIDDFLFVHGEFDFSLPDPFGPMGEESMLWGRGNPYPGLKPVVCGHTPLRLDRIEEGLSTCRINIDNGCCFCQEGYGSLLAYDLDNGHLHIQKNIEDPYP